MKKVLGLVVVLIFLLSCEKEIPAPYNTYLIPKGKHSGFYKISALQSEVLSFSAIFNESAIYETQVIENQHDINKLVGFADCNSHHHDNSARFGWRWLDDKLEIHAYTYLDGERRSEYIGTVKLNEPSLFQLRMTDTEYHFQLEGFAPVIMEREAPCSMGLYYMLYPYFGGDEVAPHDITIDLLFHY